MRFMHSTKQGGFTLIEVVLAMFLLLIGATTILGMLSFGAGTARTANLRDEASAALPTILSELEETLFPLVLDEYGLDVAGEPIEAAYDLPVPDYPRLSYSYQTTPLDAADDSPALEYVVDISIAWLEGGNRRSQDFQTILLREVPFGERLRRRFVEGTEPMSWEEHQAALAAAREKAGSASTQRVQGLDTE